MVRSTASASTLLAERGLATYPPAGRHNRETALAAERRARRPFRVPARIGPVALVTLAAPLLVLLLGQCLMRDRAQTTAGPPPPIRARFDAIYRLVRPGTANLPAMIEKAPPGRRDGERSRTVWVADWRSPGSESSGFRLVLDDRTGRVLLVGGIERTGRAAAGDGEGEGPGAIRTREEAVRTARHYVLRFGEGMAPSTAVTAQRLPSKGSPSGVWRLTARRAGGRPLWTMLLDAKAGTLLHYWDLAPPKV